MGEREAVIAAQSQPQHTGWSPRARRANSCKDVTSEPLLTTAFPRFAFPLTTLVCLSCWTHFSLFSLLPLLILLPHYPPPTRATAYLISDCLAITLSTFVLCLYPVITWQISSPEKWQPSFTIFFFSRLDGYLLEKSPKDFCFSWLICHPWRFLPSVATWHFHSLFKPFLTRALPRPAPHHSRWPCFSLHTGQYKNQKQAAGSCSVGTL